MRRSLIVLSILLLAVPAAAQPAADGPPSPSELREQLIPVYQALKTDPQFLAFKPAFANGPPDGETMRSFLQLLPMSPVEYMEIDMYVNRYETVIPRFIHDLGEQWIALHPELAREQYGQAKVDKALAALVDAGANDGDAELVERGAPVVGTNRNSASGFPGNTPDDYQGEVAVAVNPNNASQIVSATNTWDTGMQSVFYSSDGGVTWGHSFPPLGSAALGEPCTLGNEFGSDPALVWDNSNNVYLEYMAICTDGFFTTLFSIIVTRSTDGGATWSPQGTVVNSWTSGTLEDKEFLYYDRYGASPFTGRMYTCWDRGNNEKSAYSTDSGATWTEVDLPAAGAGLLELGCEMEVEDDGTVHVIWDALTCGASCTNEQMFYSQSTDGGLTWSAASMLVDFNLVGFSNVNCPGAQDNRCINPFGAIAADNSGGACDGNLYVVFSDWTSGGVEETDVWMIRSTDGGSTWSSPLKINDDGVAGRPQFHPFALVDQSTGDLVVAWHDTRNSVGDANEVDYYLARSIDCGVSFEANVQASADSAEFNNTMISYSNENSVDNVNANPNQYGEYLGLDVLNGVAYLAWADTRHFFPGSPGETEAENVGFTTVTFENNLIFADGFESGDTTMWDITVP